LLFSEENKNELFLHSATVIVKISYKESSKVK